MTDLLHRCVKSDYILSVSHHSLIILRKEQSCIQFQVPAALLTFSTCVSVCLHIYTLCACGSGVPAGCAGARGTKPAHSEAMH